MFFNTVDSIVKDFNKVVIRLDKLIASRQQGIETMKSQQEMFKSLIYEQDSAILANKAEITRAQTVKEKINNLLSI